MRLFKAVLLLLMLVSAVSVTKSVAQGVRIVHTVDQQRDGHYTANVMITNMTSTSIRNWTMSFRLDTHVENIEHVSWTSFQNVFSISGQGWTRTIEPGGVVWLTISGLAYNGQVEVPRNCFFNGNSCTIEGAPTTAPPVAAPDDMIVSAWIDDFDATTYRGFIVVQNPTNLDFPAPWDLKFSTPSLIVEMENVIWTRSGSDYQIHGSAHTDYIAAHDFVLIPFRGVHTGTPSEPTNCRLNGFLCSFRPPDSLVETPWMRIFMKLGEYTDTTWEGYIRIENPFRDELSSWTLRFRLPMTITEMDGMQWERSGDFYTVRPAWGRGRIKSNSEYTFTFAGIWEDKIEAPESCTINGRPCMLSVRIQQDVEQDGVIVDNPSGDDDTGDDTATVSCDNPGSGSSVLPEIDFRFISVQAATYVGFIDITNTGIDVILGWTLEFKLVDGMSVGNIWPADWMEIGGNYRVSSIDVNDCIAPGKTIRLSILGAHNGNFAEPIGCNFDGNICIFQRSISTANEEPVSPGESVVLYSAYPNPFNPRSRISFEVDRSQTVRVELFDALGRLRDTLFNGYAAGGRRMNISIDGSEMTSGVYFVRLVSEIGAAKTQKIILQK